MLQNRKRHYFLYIMEANHKVSYSKHQSKIKTLIQETDKKGTIPLLIPTWYTNVYINYIKLNSSKYFERHPLIFRSSIILIVHVLSLGHSHSIKVNYCFIVLGICYHFVKKETTMCGCIALCWTISVP